MCAFRLHSFARATTRSTTWPQAPEKNGTSSFSASAFAWAVPGTGLALWAPQAPGPGYPLFGPKRGRKFRNAQNRFLKVQKRSAEVVEGVFETLEHGIFSQTCLFAALDLSSCRNDKNETAISQKSRFFRVCPVTDIQTENRSAWQPPAPRRKFASRGRALASPLQ